MLGLQSLYNLEKRPMQKIVLRTGVLFSAGLIAFGAWLSVKSAEGQAQKVSAQSQIERGKYLVEDVAMCIECHTPRTANGDLDKNAWLQGAPIWIMPVKPIANWAQQAPSLAGFPSFTEEEGERVLEKGEGPEGEVLRPPMHVYHMKPEDAKAIIAYLKSLPAPRR